MHVYRCSITHTFFPGFHLRAFTHISLEREREEEKKKNKKKKQRFSHKEMHVYRFHTHNFSRFSFEGFYTHITGEREREREKKKREKKTPFTQGNACIQAFFHTILPDFHTRAFTHTHTSFKKLFLHKDMHVYIVISHNPSTFSCEGFYTHITHETLFTQENECIKAFSSHSFPFLFDGFYTYMLFEVFLLV